MSIRSSLLLCTVVAAALMSGCCCGPVGCGAGGFGGGRVTNCNDCDGGISYGGGYAGPSSFQRLANFRKSLVCGGGCGEVYYGEWTSTPPDGCDPCSGGQFVGGATPCRPFCWNWRPGSLLAGFFSGLYGRRVYGGCGCGSYSCGGGCGGGFSDGGCGGGFSGGGFSDGGGGCGCGGGGGYVDSGIGFAANHQGYVDQGYIDQGYSTAAGTGARIASPQSNIIRDHRSARASAISRGVQTSTGNRTRYR